MRDEGRSLDECRNFFPTGIGMYDYAVLLRGSCMSLPHRADRPSQPLWSSFPPPPGCVSPRAARACFCPQG